MVESLSFVLRKLELATPEVSVNCITSVGKFTLKSPGVDEAGLSTQSLNYVLENYGTRMALTRAPSRSAGVKQILSVQSVESASHFRKGIAQAHNSKTILSTAIDLIFGFLNGTQMNADCTDFLMFCLRAARSVEICVQ